MKDHTLQMLLFTVWSLHCNQYFISFLDMADHQWTYNVASYQERYVLNERGELKSLILQSILIWKVWNTVYSRCNKENYSYSWRVWVWRCVICYRNQRFFDEKQLVKAFDSFSSVMRSRSVNNVGWKVACFWFSLTIEFEMNKQEWESSLVLPNIRVCKFCLPNPPKNSKKLFILITKLSPLHPGR